MAQQQEEEEAAAAAATEEVTPILVPYLGAPLPGEVAVVRVEAEGAASRGPDGAGVERMGARPRDHVEAALRLIEPSAADAPSLVDAGGGGSCGCVREAMKTELCGFELMKVVALLASVVLPLLDASSDWGVTATFYANDDINWFKAGLTIQLIAGSFAGLFLCCFLGKETGSTGCCVSCGLFRCLERVTDEIREMCGVCAYMCCGLLPIILVTLALCVVMGMAGLAPVAVAIITLRHGYQMSESSSWSQEKTKQDSQLLKLAKGMELVLEAVPQSLLQTYIGVSYGQINPSSEYFNPVLASSIGLSLFGAALTLFGLEMEFRNDKGDVTIKLGTRYGLVTLLLRASQLGAAIFWVALLGCGIKEGALTLVVLTVWLFVWILIESMMLREGDRDKPAGCEVCCFFCCVPTYFCLRIPMGSVLAPAVLWATHLALVGSMATMFYRRQHVPNNYAAYPNMSAPVGLPGDENHYDCHDRTSGIYPGVLCACGSVVFGLLSLMMDPKHGNKRCMGLSYAERRLRAFKAASVGMNDQQTTVAMILQIWKWADIGRDGRLSAQDVDRWIRETEIAVEDEEGTPARITDITMLSHDILGNPMYTPPPVNPNDKPIPRPREPTRDQFILWYSAAWQKRLAVPAMQFVPADNTVGSPWLKGQLAKICTSHESAAPTYQYVQLRKDPVKQSLSDVLRKELITGSVGWCVKGVSAKDPSGKVGEVTINPDGDGDVKLRYADGTESGYLKASSLSPTGVSDSMESEEKIYHDSLLAKGDREYLCKFVAGRVVQVHHANVEEASVADQAPLPGGSWKRTARNYEVRQGLTAEHPATLHAELQKADGTWTQATVDMKEDCCECFANTDGKFTTAEPEPPQLNFNGRSYSIEWVETPKIEWVETGSLRTTRHPASAVRATKPGRHAIVIRKLEPTEGEWRVGDLRRVRDYAKDVHTDGVSTDGYTDVVDLVRPLADGSDAIPPGAEHLYGVPVEDLIDPRAVPDDGTVDAYIDSNTTPCELDMVAGQRFDLFRQTLWEDVLRLRHEVKGLIARDISRFLASVDPVPAVYEVGTKVEGQYVGEAWYPGTIAAVDDAGASYTLDWDDGDQEERKQPAERVRLPQRSAEPLPLSSQERIDAMAAIDARIEDHWDPAWGSSSVLDGFGSVQVRRRYIAAVDAVLARYDTAERFATLDVNDLVSEFGFESAHRDKLREYRNQTDEPPVITGVKESQLERVSMEEWDKHMPLILKRRLGHPACRELVEAHFNDRLELALPRKGRGGSGLLGTLLGLD
eukprot:COSAG02_NODE_4162_length_5685_cov_3.282492_1_plen_1276_part_00